MSKLMFMNNDLYGQFLDKKSSQLNHALEDLKKLESYAVCAKDTNVYFQNFVESQLRELQKLLSEKKISKESFDVSSDILRNTLNASKSVEDEALKNFYMMLGTTEFIKREMTDLVNERAFQAAAQEDAQKVQETNE